MFQVYLLIGTLLGAPLTLSERSTTFATIEECRKNLVHEVALAQYGLDNTTNPTIRGRYLILAAECGDKKPEPK